VEFRARIAVTLKPGVNDPQGNTVRTALHDLGFQEVEEVRVGRYVEVRLSAPDEETARARVREMCDRLLANPVVEAYRFDLEPAPAPNPAG